MKLPDPPSGTQRVAEMMRQKDWSKTPLGATDSWPQSLRTVVRLMLDSRYAMWMSWGPDRTFFCNDAYLPTVGVRRDWVIGARSDEVWKEIWPDIGPRIDRVMQTGEATWDDALLLFLERSGYPEETYHTFSYSPLYGDDGAIGGHLCVVTEETERVIGARRLDSLRELGTGLAGGGRQGEFLETIGSVLSGNRKDLPFSLLYLYDDDEHLRLATACGIAASHPATVARLGATDEALRRRTRGTAPLVLDIGARFPELPTGDWDRPPKQAVFVPIAQQGRLEPAGFIAVGLNPYREFDPAYATFLDLLAGQIASGHANARAYEQERRRAEALAELDRAKTAFFSNVSHEFRTPLTLLLGPLEQILAAAAVDGPTRDLANVAHRNGLRLLKLVNALLDFSRLEAGRIEARFVPCDLGQYTTDLAANFRSVMSQAGLEYVIDCPSRGEPVYVDQDFWERIVLNLVSNAFKFTLSGRIEVRLQESSDGGHVELVVSDTGSGIPAAELPHVFERFHRVEGTIGRSVEGSGIGLALVKELVQLHRGTIDVTSRPGGGTRFVVSLPLGRKHLPADRIAADEGAFVPAQSHPSAARRAQAYVDEAFGWLPQGRENDELSGVDSLAASEDVGGAFQGHGERIVLADDNSDMRDYVRRLLKSGGYQVVTCSDGEEALAAVRREAPDLVLSDVMMPKLDGFALLDAIRRDPERRSVPVLLLSARAGEEARVDGLHAGADDYLTKPFAARELLARVDSTLHAARFRRETERALAELNSTLEQRVIERSEELRQSEQQFRILVEGVTDYAIFMLHTDGTVASWNTGAERIKGYDESDILGRHFSCFYTPEDQAAGLPERMLRTAAETGKAENEGWRVRKDGTRFWATVVMNAIHDASGELIGFAKITRDSSERRLVEEQLRQAQKMEAVGQLTGGVAHDFNNLLVIILGNLETLLRQLDGGEIDAGRIRRASENALRGAQRAASLTQRLLAFARRQPLEPKPVDVNRLVSNMSELLRRTLGEQITIETVLAGGLWHTHTDPNQLESAILNLAVNSRDAMPNGGKLTIETANAHLDHGYIASHAEVAPGQYVLVAITDNGTGMSREVLAHVFEPFYTTKDIGQGTGLGLSQVYGFVKQSGGHIKIYSEPGEGTTVRIYLPRLQVRLADLAPAPSTDIEIRSGASETILVVEDDDDVRQHSTQLLKEMGYRVLEAPNGAAALDILSRQREIQLLFSDIGLPGGMNGRQLADEAQRRFPGLKVLFTTGYARNAIVHDGRLDPGVSLITKPFTFSGLASKVAELLAGDLIERMVLVVEDDESVRLVIVEALQSMGYRVGEAASALEAANRFRAAGDYVEAVVIDIGLPDRRGDALAADLRAMRTKLPIIIASGYAESPLRFRSDPNFRFLTKPYDSQQLHAALASMNVKPRSPT